MLIKFAFLNFINKETIEQISEIFSEQQNNPSQMFDQSKKIQELIIKNPQIINLIFAGLGLMILFVSYNLAASQRIFKKMIIGEDTNIVWYFKPFKETISILIYLLVFSPIFITVFSLGIISIKSNPVFSIISLFFLIMVVIRSILFAPGIVIGEMQFSDALKYSFQTITGGRAFKIAVFGVLNFIIISLVLQILLYIPMNYIKFDKSDLYFNFLVIFLQTGIISVGLASLFTRYGSFEEQNDV
ncbi:MAG: hypothetical protein HUU47_02460 [Bacteroidetes bacterium]|nr:hypothetical protein [Bacteroidota bacterium]